MNNTIKDVCSMW